MEEIIANQDAKVENKFEEWLQPVSLQVKDISSKKGEK